MTMTHWGRGLLIWGVIAAVISTAPALVLSQLPAIYSDSFFGDVAVLLTFSVAPLAVLSASVGAILLLLAALRRRRS
jgi:hypothetical protein